MRVSRIHEQQGSLLDGFPPEVPESVDLVDPIPEEVPLANAVEITARALNLHHTLGHLAYLSKTAKYVNIDTIPWFQATVSRQHPHDYQQHVDEVLETRERRTSRALADFSIAFGVDAMIESGDTSTDEANQMARDFYNGTNNSERNPNEESFKLTYADSTNNKNLNVLRKKLEKQNRKLKK